MAEMMAGLNLVLVGRTGIGKSASGNTILGRQAFISKKSSTSVTQEVAIESGTVNGRWVTVYDTPGLFNTDMSEKEVQQKYEEVLQRCESGPCVFLLVIKPDRFTGKERRTVEKIEELLGEERLKKTWILFTGGDELEDENMTMDEFIHLSEPLKRLVQKYEQRYHVFNNKKKGLSDQARTLLEKIIQKSSRLKDMPPGLTVVLLGKTGAGKSSTGNTILGRPAFIAKKTSKSVTQDIAVASGAFGELPVHVYDTPGVIDTGIKEQELQLNYQNLFQKCESGLCVFLLVIKADRFTEEERKTVEKIEELLGEKRLEKTWILFTRGDELEEENTTIKEFIDDTEPLKRLVQKYEQRYHVFNNKKKEHTGQVQRLIFEILKPYFEIQGEGAEILNPLKRKDQTDFEPAAPVSSPSSRRIVLLGKTGVGKSAAGNTILGQKEFNSVMRMSSVLSECSDAHATVSGRSVTVVDTPGLFDTEINLEDLMTEIAKSVYISSPGPHAFLIVFPVNMRFTEHEQQIPQIIEILFGQEVLKYSIILFTHGDLLEGQTVEELIQENCRLRDLVDQCGGRFHVFNNKAQNNREQVNDLLQKIDSMIEQNGGGHYSNQMFEDALRFRQEEEEQRLREEEERKQREERRIQEEIERVRKEEEERVRAEMKAEYEKKSEEERRKQEQQRKEELERKIKETEERIRAESKASQGGFKTSFLKFCFKYKRHFQIAAVVAGIIVGAAVGAGAGALVGAAVKAICAGGATFSLLGFNLSFGAAAAGAAATAAAAAGAAAASGAVGIGAVIGAVGGAAAGGIAGAVVGGAVSEYDN